VWNLAPTIILTNPTTDFSDPNVRLYIDTEKSLQYSPELGWNWHKSWNLPNISLRLEVHLKPKVDKRLKYRGASSGPKKPLCNLFLMLRPKCLL
jgi:hypothetical protein